VELVLELEELGLLERHESSIHERDHLELALPGLARLIAPPSPGLNGDQRQGPDARGDDP
jgi:hypothetical protein